MERGEDRERSLQYFLLKHVRGDMCQTTKNSFVFNVLKLKHINE